MPRRERSYTSSQCNNLRRNGYCEVLAEELSAGGQCSRSRKRSFQLFFYFEFQNKRTPLHFAAALQDGGAMYRMLRRTGADPDLLDCV